MNVQFVKPGARPQRAVAFCNATNPTVIRLLAKETDWVKVWLHWFNGRSVPCLGRECKHCHEEPRCYAYAAAIAGKYGPRGFENGRPVIVCLTDACWGLTEGDYRNHAIELRRLGQHKNAELTYRILGGITEPIEPPFPIRDRVMSVWKIRISQDDVEAMMIAADLRRMRDAFAASSSMPEDVT